MITSLNPLSSMVVSDTNVSQGAKRLENDPGMAERFAELTYGMKTGLKSGVTPLTKLPDEVQDSAPRSLQHRLINDVTSLEKGLAQIINQNDLNALRHRDASNSHDGVSQESSILFEYANFSARYFVATNYIGNSGLRTSEEIQVFTRSR